MAKCKKHTQGLNTHDLTKLLRWPENEMREYEVIHPGGKQKGG